MNTDAIRRVRRFNRTVAQAIGMAGGRFLGRSRAPGESRMLWEIGADGIELRTLRRRLELDSGYLTRVLQSLARQRLVRVRIDAADRRVRRVELTPRGRAERALLDRRSDQLAASLLQPLSGRHRDRLVAAMAEVEQLLLASTVRFVVVDPRSSDASWCLAQYFDELNARFDTGFDPARSISADATELTPPAGLLVLAYSRERPIGCGALKFHRHGSADVKRMWIRDDARGMGVGARLLAELERYARKAGAGSVRLETNRALTEAIALYRRSGYVEVDRFNDEPYAHHWFEKRLAHQRRR